MAPTKSSANLARKPPVPSSKKADSAADRQVAELQRQIAAASEREAALANLLESSGVDSIAGGAIDWELDAARALLDEEVRRNFAHPQYPQRTHNIHNAPQLIHNHPQPHPQHPQPDPQYPQLHPQYTQTHPQYPQPLLTRAQAAELEALERDWQLVTESNAGLKSMVAAQLALAAQLDEMPAC